MEGFVTPPRSVGEWVDGIVRPYGMCYSRKEYVELLEEYRELLERVRCAKDSDEYLSDVAAVLGRQTE